MTTSRWNLSHSRLIMQIYKYYFKAITPLRKETIVESKTKKESLAIEEWCSRNGYKIIESTKPL